VITAIDPAYLGLALGHRRIDILPVSRSVEYASKVVVQRKIASPSPFPSHSADHRAEGILRGGSIEAVERTADEMLDAIAEQIRNGSKYVLETGNLRRRELPAVARILDIFPVTTIGPNLYLLAPPNAPPSSQED
jgi:hypothetical protein